VLVAGSYLGTISHTLTALSVLGQAGANVRAIVISESAESPVPLAETAATIGRFAGDAPVFQIPRAGTENGWRHAGGLTPVLGLRRKP
jgi:dethiobiotin synthetase